MNMISQERFCTDERNKAGQGTLLFCQKGDNMLNLNYEPDVLVEDITTLSHDEWKLYRTLGIGGSDAAAVCGISPWKQPGIYMKRRYIKKSENRMMMAG
jgi:hypothetical protein